MKEKRSGGDQDKNIGEKRRGEKRREDKSSTNNRREQWREEKR